MSKPESAVTYDGLPISSGGAHGLGKMSSRDAYGAWARFLGSCTCPGAVSSYFTFPQTPELLVEPRVRALIAAAFPPDYREFRYHVPTERVDEALGLLTSIEPQPKNQWGMSPVWLCFSADVVLLRPDGEPWPGQDPDAYNFQTPAGIRLGASRAELILEGRPAMSLRFSLPAATDADLAVFAPWLQDNLPFRLSPKQWRRWTLAKNGTTYRGRKISL